MNGYLASLEEAVPGLRRYALAMLPGHREADDMVRRCLAKAIGRLHESGDAAGLRVWLFAMIYRELAHRWRQPRRGRLSSSFGNNVSSIASTELARAFGGLPLEQRSAMFLISVEDFSYAAAAEVMGLPTMTLVDLLKAGREQLRESTGAGASGPPPTGS
jgi:DNA-directed RNA polymerase specialized sigma24 family protein